MDNPSSSKTSAERTGASVLAERPPRGPVCHTISIGKISRDYAQTFGCLFHSVPDGDLSGTVSTGRQRLAALTRQHGVIVGRSRNSTQSQVPDGQFGKTGSSLALMRRLFGRMCDEGLACTCLRRPCPDVDIGRNVVGDRRSGIVCVCHHLPDFGLQPLTGGAWNQPWPPTWGRHRRKASGRRC